MKWLILFADGAVPTPADAVGLAETMAKGGSLFILSLMVLALTAALWYREKRYDKLADKLEAEKDKNLAKVVELMASQISLALSVREAVVSLNANIDRIQMMADQLMRNLKPQ